jgi:hypothetical protein
MKINRKSGPPIVIGMRVTIGQVILSIVNGTVFWYNWRHPEQPLPGEIVGIVAQPLIFIAQVWWANRYGITSPEGGT